MVIAYKVHIDAESLQKRMLRIKKNMKPALQALTHNIAVLEKESIKRQYLIQQKKAPRAMTANRFATRKVNLLKWEVTIPLKAHYLDTMRPHYVALRRGRMITKWARKYYGPDHIKRGRSRVYRGPAGGIKGGFIYVTKDPFVTKGTRRVAGRINTMTRKTMNKVFGVD